MLSKFAARNRYHCPFCRKRFKAIPQRTIHSPFPTCPRCGVPVAEEHQIQAFDRTRKVLRILSVPTLAPFKLIALMCGLGLAGTKVSTLGIVGILWALIKMPVTVVREYRKKRFADPATLEKHLREVKNQWKNPGATAGERYTNKVVLTPAGKEKYPHSERNPHELEGTPISHEFNVRGKRDWFIKWDNGKTNGPYNDEDIQFIPYHRNLSI